MLYSSLAQEGYFHTHKKQLEKQGVNVDEWDKATKGKKLPWHARKTKHMNSHTRLIQLSSDLDDILRFDYGDDDEQQKKSLLKPAALVGAGVGGTLTHQAINRSGGYAAAWNKVAPTVNANLTSAKSGFLAGMGKIASPGAAGDAASKIGQGLGRAASTGKSAIGALLATLKGVQLSALLDDIIEFKFRLTEDEFKDRFGMTPDELNRQTKTGPYESPSKRKARRIFAGGLLAGGLGLAAGQSIQNRGGYQKVARDIIAPVKRRADAGFEGAGISIARSGLQGAKPASRLRRAIVSGAKAARHA